MTGRPEELDDLIDRVAAGLTFAPADETRAAGDAAYALSRRNYLLNAPRLIAMAVAVVLVVAAIGLWRETPVERAVSRERPAQAQPRVESALSNDRKEAPFAAAPAPVRQTAHVTAVGEQLDAAPASGIELLASPSLLSVADLPIDSLTIGAVDLAPLDVPSLAVTDIGSLDPKE